MTLMVSKRRDVPPRTSVAVRIDPATYDRIMAEAEHQRLTLQGVVALIVADAVAQYAGEIPDTSPQAIAGAREAYTELTPRRRQPGSTHVGITVLVDLRSLVIIDTEARRVGMTRSRLVAAILNGAARNTPPRGPVNAI